MENDCRFCGKTLEEKDIKDMYCHCCKALTYEVIYDEVAKKLRGSGWELTTKTTFIAAIREYEKMEEQLNNIRKEVELE